LADQGVKGVTVFKLPDLGEGLSEAEILRWHVNAGDHVDIHAPLLSVETAKAVVEVPSPVSGRIVSLRAQAGDRVEIGAPLVEFASDDFATHAATPADSGTVVGLMPDTSEEESAGATLATSRTTTDGCATARVRAVPAARALARSLDVDLAQLTGTGRDGLITLDDVMAGAAPTRGSREDGAVEGLRSLRRTMAQSMALARDSIMQCSVFDDADLHAWRTGGDYTVRVLRAISAGVRAEPGLNAWFDARSHSRTLFDAIDVGVAVDTDDGLLVPVIRQVHQRSALQLREELDRLKRTARERTLAAEQLRDFTFMLSNFGTMAGRYATPVVVPPAVAILGTGRVRPDVVAVGDRIEIHLRMPLSLTFDHRVVTGAEAVRFLAAVLANLEQPE
jgi:pyruvate dehydrogenase E2 component (dihydrolipoamide acetyltransferase)